MQLERVEVWTDVGCNAGERIGVFLLGAIAQCVATTALDGQEGLVLSVPRTHPYADTLRRGRVVRVQDSDPTVYEEWRVADLEDDTGSLFVTARCDSIALDLARAVYMAIDGIGAPTAEYSVAGATLTDIVDGLVRDALDAAGLTYLVTGTIEPTTEIDLDGEWGSARSILLDAIGKAGGELRVRRNGSTDYRIDILDSIGSDAAMPTIRTARNLLSTKRRRSGSLGGTRIVPRGRDDATHRGIGYAYWEITDVDTGADTITIRDPRGAGYPSPLPFSDMAVGWWASKWASIPDPREVVASVDGPNDGTAVITLDSADGYNVGEFVELGYQAFEEIAYDSSTGDGSTTWLPSPRLAGDLLVAVGFRTANNTAITVPSGWDVVTADELTDCSYAVATQRVTADATGGTVTFTNAAHVIVMLYRDTDRIGAVAVDTGTSATIDYPALATNRQNTTSWVMAIAGHRAATDTQNTPTGLTTRRNVSGRLAVHDSDGTEDSYAGDSVGVNANDEWFAITLEIEARPSPLTRLWGLTDPATVTASAGIYDRILDRPALSGAVNRWPNPFLSDFSGTIEVPSGTGKVDASTSSAVVTAHSGSVDFVRQVSIGDRILRASDNALVGTVQAIDNYQQITLTANALVTITAAEFTVQKDAPIGSLWISAPQNTQMLTAQVASVVPGLTGAYAWRIEAAPSYDALVRLGTASIPTNTNTPYLIWAWVRCVSIPSPHTCRISLRDITASTANSIIGAEVELTHDNHDGQLVRVVFQSYNLAAADGGVGIGIFVDDSCILEVGPVGAVPSAWNPLDTATPFANDLWHEGTLWLQSQTVPTGYEVDLLDLYTIDDTLYPYEALTLGGTVQVDDRDLGVLTTQRLVALSRDYLTPGSTQVTLGNRTKGLAEYLAVQNTQSVADIALSISRSLITQAQVITDAPPVVVTSAGTTIADPEPLYLVATAMQDAYTSTP